MPNYAWTTGKDLPEGTTFEHTNFHRMEPHTAIFTGRTGMTFRNCNLLNCDLPEGSTVEGGLRGHISHCSHVHPEWVAKGLTECATECDHLVSTDEITIDGVVVDTIYHYVDKAVA